jgi:uncharacterized membrane protein
MVSAQTAISRRIASGTLTPGRRDGRTNVGDSERFASAAGGSLLVLYGLSRGSLAGLGLATVGGALLYRGVTGHCHVYASLGVNTADRTGRATSVRAGRGVRVDTSVTVNEPAEELYRFWRDFANLPRFMSHLVSIRTEGERSHWVARGPAGKTVGWDAEIINERPNELIAWRSLPGSEVANAGSVHFTPAPAGRGTVVRVELKYEPPAGRLGAAVAWLFGEEPNRQVREDLRRFKQLMEAGEIPTTRGQPSCRH